MPTAMADGDGGPVGPLTYVHTYLYKVPELCQLSHSEGGGGAVRAQDEDLDRLLKEVADKAL